MKLLRVLFQSMVAAANVFIVVLLIASAFSDRVSPNSMLIFSYLGLAFPILVLINLCFLGYWLFFRKWYMSLIPLVGFLLSINALQIYFPLHLKTATIPDPHIKVLSYNVMNFAYKDHTEEKHNPILDYIVKSNADIVCLQEYWGPLKGSHLKQADIKRALKMYPYFKVLSSPSAGNDLIGIAVFSKYPIRSARKVKYDSAYNLSGVFELDVKGKKVTLINNHLESFKLTLQDREDYESFLKSMNSNMFDELKSRLHGRLGPAFRQRAHQAEVISNEVQKAKGDYVVVCGDFNDTPISYVRRTVQNGLKDAFVESGFGMGSSFNRNLFYFKIDYILHSSNMKAYNCTVDNDISESDHYPIWCYLTFK